MERNETGKFKKPGVQKTINVSKTKLAISITFFDYFLKLHAKR